MIEALDFDADCYTSEHKKMILVGPPGTGKTRTMLHGWLVPAVKDGLEVLATSFTKAAALEIRGRLAALTGEKEDNLKNVCRTIHSEAYRIERMESGKIAIYDDDATHTRSKKKKANDEDEAEKIDLSWVSLMSPQKYLRKETVRLWDKARNKYWPDEIDTPRKDLLIRVRNDSVMMSKHPMDALVADLDAYEAEKTATGTIDFVDLLVRGLRNQAPVRDLLLIDEAQDLSPLQIALMERWAKKARRTVLIGDPDQGIFGFCGADGTYLTREIMAGTTARLLTQSYRVPRKPHEFARKVITRNDNRVDAPYLPTPVEGVVRSYGDAGDALIDACVRLRDNPKTSSCFVLARSGKALARYAAWLAGAGEPYTAERGVSSPVASKINVALLTGIESLRSSGMIRADDAVRLAQAVPGRGPVRWFSTTKKAAVDKLEVFADEKAEQYLDARTVQGCGLDVAKMRAIKTTEEVAKTLGVDDLWPLLAIVKRHGAEALRAEPRMKLTTFHTSKGREADTVIVDLECPYPCALEIENMDYGANSERRALYVAATRTRSDLYLVAGDQRDLRRMLHV